MERRPLVEIVPWPFEGDIEMLQECTVQLDTDAIDLRVLKAS